MDRKEAIERLFYLKSKAENALINSNSHCDWLINDVKGTINALSLAIEALQEQERIIKQLEELRDEPLMYCSEDYWEGHYIAAKEAIAIVRGEEE